MAVANEIQPVTVLVNVKLATPGLTPVTTPLFVIVAMEGLEEIHNPPLPGITVVVEPIQIPTGPEMLTTGRA